MELVKIIHDLAVAKAQVVLSEYRNANPDKCDSFGETEVFVNAYRASLNDLNINYAKIQ